MANSNLGPPTQHLMPRIENRLYFTFSLIFMTQRYFKCPFFTYLIHYHKLTAVRRRSVQVRSVFLKTMKHHQSKSKIIYFRNNKFNKHVHKFLRNFIKQLRVLIRAPVLRKQYFLC
jgi:hypothetical protein